MTLQQVAIGLHIMLAIAVIGLSVYSVPMLYSFWKNQK